MFDIYSLTIKFFDEHQIVPLFCIFIFCLILYKLHQWKVLYQILFENCKSGDKLSISRLFLVIIFVWVNAFMFKAITTDSEVKVPDFLTEIFTFLLLYALGSKGISSWRSFKGVSQESEVKQEEKPKEDVLNVTLKDPFADTTTKIGE